jgi:hypothetical protein
MGWLWEEAASSFPILEAGHGLNLGRGCRLDMGWVWEEDAFCFFSYIRG